MSILYLSKQTDSKRLNGSFVSLGTEENCSSCPYNCTLCPPGTYSNVTGNQLVFSIYRACNHPFHICILKNKVSARWWERAWMFLFTRGKTSSIVEIRILFFQELQTVRCAQLDHILTTQVRLREYSLGLKRLRTQHLKAQYFGITGR